MTFYDTGLRLSALMQARVEDLDFANRWLRVPAEAQKQNADQLFRLHLETVQLIQATDPGGREELFPWMFPADGNFKRLWNHYCQILQRAGLPAGPRDLFHKLRRTHATHLADAAGEAAAQESCGHSSPQVTRRYLDPRQIGKRIVATDVMARPNLNLKPFNPDAA